MNITVDLPPNEQGQRLRAYMDTSLLIRHDGVIDNDNERTTTTEYCVLGCQGKAHQSGIPDAASHFCNHHVHRSGHVTLKKWPDAVGTAIGELG